MKDEKDVCLMISKIATLHCNKKLQDFLEEKNDKMIINKHRVAVIFETRKEVIKKFPCCKFFI